MINYMVYRKAERYHDRLASVIKSLKDSHEDVSMSRCQDRRVDARETSYIA